MKKSPVMPEPKKIFDLFDVISYMREVGIDVEEYLRQCAQDHEIGNESILHLYPGDDLSVSSPPAQIALQQAFGDELLIHYWW